MQYNWLLAATACVLLLGMLLGWFRGFFRMFFVLVSGVLSLVFLALLIEPTTMFLTEHTTLEKKIEASVREHLEEKLADAIPQEAADALSGDPSGAFSQDAAETLLQEADEIPGEFSLPAGVRSLLSDSVFSKVKEEIAAGASYSTDTVLASASQKIAGMIVRAIAYLLDLILVFLLFRLVFASFRALREITVVRYLDKTAGLFLGLILALAFFWVCFLMLCLFCDTGWGASCLSLIEESRFLLFLSEHNPLLSYLLALL